MTVPVLPSLDPSHMFPFHLLPSPDHPTGFSFYFLSRFLAIFILLSSNNNNSCSLGRIRSFKKMRSHKIVLHVYIGRIVTAINDIIIFIWYELLVYFIKIFTMSMILLLFFVNTKSVLF